MSMQALMSAMNAGMSLSRMQTVSSVSTRTQGRANVLKAEVVQDGGKALGSKAQEAQELEEKAQGMMGELMEGLNEVNQTMKPDETEKPEEAAKPDESGTKTDKVELSAHPEQDGKTVVRAEQPAVYHADGSSEPVAAAAVGLALEARA